MIFSKIMIIYILVYILALFTFFKFKDKHLRFILTTIIYVLFGLISKFNIRMIIFYFILAIICVGTESIFINFFDETWEYKNPDIIEIPFWLIPLWGIAILLIINISKNIDF